MDQKREGVDERRTASWIGRMVKISGDVVSTGDLVIDGQVTGTIELGDHSLTIGPTAAVVADLSAKTITVSGKVKGNVMGAAKVELKSTGSIEGDVSAPAFVMDEGASLSGKVDAHGKRPAAPKP
jgi:cytoskeletal protein CcmA (bactofilin family)